MNREELRNKLNSYLKHRDYQPIHSIMEITTEVLAKSYSAGLLPKEQFKDGQYYFGICRNASVARWYANPGAFVYIRTKFGSCFPEKINCPEDSKDRYDVFLAVAECEPEWSEKTPNNFFEGDA